jgi:hypothetical protein
MAKQFTSERVEQLANLRKWLKPGDTVYTILESRAASGMSRWIRVLIPYVNETGEIGFIHPNYAVSIVLNLRRDGNHEGVMMQGCGMDMGYEIVYRLGKALWPEGTPEPHGSRNGSPDSDGGYALKHRWL